eukprot:11373891-Ditylum_brightwellii.AAC.1
MDELVRYDGFLICDGCCYKLNNNETTPKRGKENYDPAYKFSYLWKHIFTMLMLLLKLHPQIYVETKQVGVTQVGESQEVVSANASSTSQKFAREGT